MKMEKFELLEVIDEKYLKIMEDYKANDEHIRNAITEISFNFIEIGSSLNKIKLHGYYKYDNYKDIYEYALDRFNIKETTVKNLIAIANSFCDDDGFLKEEFSDYNYSQLVELSKINEENYGDISPDMSVREIKQIRLESKLNEEKQKKFSLTYEIMEKLFEKYFENLVEVFKTKNGTSFVGYKYSNIDDMKITYSNSEYFEKEGGINFEFENKIKLKFKLQIYIDIVEDYQKINILKDRWSSCLCIKNDFTDEEIKKLFEKFVSSLKKDFKEIIDSSNKKQEKTVEEDENVIKKYSERNRDIFIRDFTEKVLKDLNLKIEDMKFVYNRWDYYFILDEKRCLAISNSGDYGKDKAFGKYYFDEERKKFTFKAIDGFGKLYDFLGISKLLEIIGEDSND